jgi:ABC-2 type transport system ATP-binding protein
MSILDSGGSAIQHARVEAGPGVGGGPTAAPALELTGLSKSWGDLRVLANVDLRLDSGQRAWVGGRNGVGKTTLLRIAAGLIVPDAGEISLHGLDVERDRRAFQARLGFLTAGNTGLYARLTVRDNVSFQAAISFVPRRRRAGAVADAIAGFGLSELAGRRVDRLSMGQRQRVRLAMAFVHSPPVMLLDEPETSLDDDGLALLDHALEAMVATGGAALVCSPSRAKLELGVDTGYVLDGGRLVPS